MSNKQLSHQWENKLEELLQYTDKEIVKSLNEIKALGLNMNEKFGKMFVNIVKNRLSETYDKFNISLSMSTSNRNESSKNTVQKPSTSTSSVNGTRTKSPARQQSQWQIELEKQRRLITGICIDGIPILDGEDVQTLFFQLCEHINFDISYKDLNEIHRDTNKSIFLDLKTVSLKRNMFRAWRQSSLSSCTFFGSKLSSRARPGRISMTDAKTPYYTMLYKIAQNAVDDRIFENCEICIHGLEITCDYGRRKVIVLSLSELDDLMNRYSKL